jgi:hypothetical protein
MKSCREIHLDASALLDGELPLLQALGLRVHLLMCRHCRRFMRHLRLVSRSLSRRAERLAAPTALVDRVLEHLECHAGLGTVEAAAGEIADFKTPGPRT